MKVLTNFWNERSAGEWPPLDYPLNATDHIFIDSDVIVREDEPSSLVAFALDSEDYKAKLADIRYQWKVTTQREGSADGEEIKADVVVLATGYTNMKSSAEKIFGKEGSKMNEVWGLDDEGELKTVWRPSGHPGLWAQAGNLALNREMSKRLALNIKARLLGLA